MGRRRVEGVSNYNNISLEYQEYVMNISRASRELGFNF
jgi:hypothetical protein